jgi:nucleolar protein 14
LDDLYSDEEDDGDHLGGFTHGGRPLTSVDDFQDDIPVSSEDEADEQKDGKLNEEMVMSMNFGGGGVFNTTGGSKANPAKEPAEKTRKEVFEEIIAKSKAYKMAKYEIKEAAKELTT